MILERDGRTLETTLRLPAGEPPWPLIVFAHGWTGHPRKFSRLFARWTAEGYAIAAPAFPRTSNEAVAPDFDDVAEQPADVRFLAERLGEDLRFGPVVHAGFSLGAITVLAAGEAAAVVAIAGRPPWFAPFDPPRCPLLVAHGRRDGLVAYEHGRAVCAAATGPKALLTIELPGHHEFVEDEPATEADAVVPDVTAAFLARVLRGTGTAPELDARLASLEQKGVW